MNPPTRREVATVLRGLITGEQSRQSAAAWATDWLLGDVRVGDPAVWEALQLIGAADLITTDRPFLYNEADFRGCLDSLSLSESD